MKREIRYYFVNAEGDFWSNDHGWTTFFWDATGFEEEKMPGLMPPMGTEDIVGIILLPYKNWEFAKAVEVARYGKSGGDYHIVADAITDYIMKVTDLDEEDRASLRQVVVDFLSEANHSPSEYYIQVQMGGERKSTARQIRRELDRFREFEDI